MTGISLSMSCPNCGGALSASEGAHYASCPYCTAMLAIEGDEGIRKIMFKDKVTRVQAVEAVQRWWKGGFKARDLV
jgi:DNA-directed RNA polymerase subunit RPC12/RpoP